MRRFEVLDERAARQLGLENGTAVFMMHSDSRKLGKLILKPLREKAEAVRDEFRRGRERARSESIREGLAALRPGDVIFVPRARRRGLAVVLSAREGRPTVLAQDRTFFRLGLRDFQEPPAVLTKVPLPRSGSVRSARYRRDLAARLVALDVRPPRKQRGGVDARVEREAARYERLAEAHPCHACPDRPEHERWAIRASQVGQQIRGLDRRIRTRMETLARQFGPGSPAQLADDCGLAKNASR